MLRAKNIRSLSLLLPASIFLFTRPQLANVNIKTQHAWNSDDGADRDGFARRGHVASDRNEHSVSIQHFGHTGLITTLPNE